MKLAYFLIFLCTAHLAQAAEDSKLIGSWYFESVVASQSSEEFTKQLEAYLQPETPMFVFRQNGTVVIWSVSRPSKPDGTSDAASDQAYGSTSVHPYRLSPGTINLVFDEVGTGLPIRYRFTDQNKLHIQIESLNSETLVLSKRQ